MIGMNFPRRFRRFRAQTVTEYMMVISVVSLGLLVALKWFDDPNGLVQTAGDELATSFEDSLDNSSGQMRVR